MREKTRWKLAHKIISYIRFEERLFLSKNKPRNRVWRTTRPTLAAPLSWAAATRRWVGTDMFYYNIFNCTWWSCLTWIYLLNNSILIKKNWLFHTAICNVIILYFHTGTSSYQANNQCYIFIYLIGKMFVSVTQVGMSAVMRRAHDMFILDIG